MARKNFEINSVIIFCPGEQKHFKVGENSVVKINQGSYYASSFAGIAIEYEDGSREEFVGAAFSVKYAPLIPITKLYVFGYQHGLYFKQTQEPMYKEDRFYGFLNVVQSKRDGENNFKTINDLKIGDIIWFEHDAYEITNITSVEQVFKDL